MAFPCAIPGINLTDYGTILPRPGWPGHCTGPFATVIINDAGARVTVDGRLAELVGLIMRANQVDGYHYRPADTGAYNCVAGETLVMTPDGDVPIGDLAGTTARVLTRNPKGGPGRWVDAPVRSYGVQPLRRVVMRRHGIEREVYATPGHRWLLDEPDRRDQERTTDQLRPGMRLATVHPQSVATRVGLSSVGAAHGIVYGDGTTTRDEGRVMLCGPKNAHLLRYFPEPHVNAYDVGLLVGQLPRSWKRLPALDEGPSYLYGFLAGYFAADGDVNRAGRIRLSSTDRGGLVAVRSICTRLGIATTAPTMVKREGIDGAISALHTITLCGKHVTDDFFLIPSHRERFIAADRRYEPARWRVVSVEETDREETVYCAEVPKTECFALAENLLTGNCRMISGTTMWSLHAWGLAVDENWQTNPYTSPLRTDKPEWLVRRWNRYGFAWGGHYSGSKDAMHFEFMGAPGDVPAALALARDELGRPESWLPGPYPSPVNGCPEVAGFDCSYNKPDAVAMAVGGHRFMVGYVSSNPAKNLTPEHVAAYRAEGLAVGLVWEETADRCLGGATAGAADGDEADRQADALGYPLDAVVWFAVDFDAGPSHMAAVGDYAVEFDRHNKRPVGVYGKADVIDALVTPGARPVRYGWQTAAWSGGRISAKANLYQRVGHPAWPVAGVDPGAYDENVALAPVPLWGWRRADPGQPLPPPPPPNPDPWHDIPMGGVTDLYAQGPQVARDQADLADTGFPVAADGFAGPATVAAIKAFQTASKVAVDGAMGPQTRAAIHRVPSWHPHGNIPDDDGGYPARTWQQKLKDHGWRIAVDNAWGAHSRSILSQFQADKRLTVDGNRGPQSWTCLWTTVN